MYGPPSCYVLLKMISTIYERIVKAKQLIHDEMTRNHKVEGIEKIAAELFDMFTGVVLLTYG